MSLRHDAPADQPSLKDAHQRIAELRREVEESHADVERAALHIAGLVTTDAATGLLNLAGMADRIQDSIYRLDRTGEPFGLMLLRVPELDVIAERVESSSYAAAARIVGEHLIAGLRAVDHVGLGEGYGFLISMPGLVPESVDAVLDRVGGAVEAASAALTGGDTDGLRPKMGLVVSHGKAVLEVPMLLDVLWTVTKHARVGTPIVVLAPPSWVAEPSQFEHSGCAPDPDLPMAARSGPSSGEPSSSR